MSQLRIVLGLACLVNLSLIYQLPGQEAADRLSIAERRATLQQRMEDCRDDIQTEENAKALAQRHYDEAQIAIRKAIAMGRTPVAEQFMAGNAMGDKRRAESEIRRLQAEIRRCEMELRQLDRGTGEPPATPAAKEPVLTAGGGAPPRPKSGIQALQGKWLSLDGSEGYHIEGNRIFVAWQTSQGVGRAVGPLTIDAAKGHFDFELGEKTTYRHWYEIEHLKNGKVILHTQFNAQDRTKRPATKLLPIEVMIGLNGQVYVLQPMD